MRKGTKTAAIFGSITMGIVLTACGGTVDAKSANKNAPKTLVGKWYQTNKVDGVMMTASVNRDNTIQVDMDNRDSRSIYWLGSFKSGKSPRHNFSTTSTADQDALTMSIFGSGDPYKSFEYKNGTLSFEFTMMGTTSKVHLRKK